MDYVWTCSEDRILYNEPMTLTLDAFRVQFLEGEGDFFPHCCIWTNFGAHSPSYLVRTNVSFPGGLKLTTHLVHRL